MAKVDLRAHDTMHDAAMRKMAASGPAKPHVSHNFTWHSGKDLMVWDSGDEQVERWRIVDNGAMRVEVWRMAD